MSARPKFASVDEYIAAAVPEVRLILEGIRALARATAPGAMETISYQMPAFKRRRVFFFFAAFKAHIGIYPPVQGDEALAVELKPYRGPKGNLKFPLSEPIPYELIGRVIAALDREING